MSFNRAGLTAIFAICLWSSFALIASSLKELPPFFLLGISFLIGSSFGLIQIKNCFPDRTNLMVGVLGLFLYHMFMFLAFRYAPALQVNLINYIWPALIVFLSPWVNAKLRLNFYHYMGIGVSFAGIALLFGFDVFIHWNESLFGKSMAFAAAITWAIYSVVLQKLKAVSVFSNAGICFICSILSFLLSFSLGESWSHEIPWPQVILLGFGPMGLSFYCWDFAMRNGDPRVIGALAFLTPILSNLWLVLFTHEIFLNNVFFSAVLVLLGCLLVNTDSIMNLIKTQNKG
ncbi:MAG: EamA family transporter [Bacteriovoracaceae bacterium]|nr:EamA family transporter [Bacteriovoracaceae bacterium]